MLAHLTKLACCNVGFSSTEGQGRSLPRWPGFLSLRRQGWGSGGEGMGGGGEWGEVVGGPGLSQVRMFFAVTAVGFWRAAPVYHKIQA